MIPVLILLVMRLHAHSKCFKVYSRDYSCRVKARVAVWTDLPTWWLREPQRPFIHERVLDIEIVFVVKDGHGVAAAICTCRLGLRVVWGDRDGIQRYLSRGRKGVGGGHRECGS